LSEKRRFGQYLGQKSANTKPSVFGAVFVIFGWLGGLFASFNYLYYHPLPGIPPANSQCTKQFLSRL
jgi:hypothetical protein